VTTFLPGHGRDEQTLLRELTHRIRNELVSSINIVSAAAVRAENPEVKVALSNVVEMLQQHADVHRLLTIPDRDGLVDAAEYIRKLGFAVSRSSLEPMGTHNPPRLSGNADFTTVFEVPGTLAENPSLSAIVFGQRRSPSKSGFSRSVGN
jgi:Histidine kinase